jgi:RND family efflux transporter MFP subunit
MSSSLKDDLASLKIDRGSSKRPSAISTPQTQSGAQVTYRPSGAVRVRKGLGWRLFTLAVWMIPLTILGTAGYLIRDQIGQMAPATEIKFATVQMMTESDIDKVLAAKGYLRSRNQAQVGAKVPGRVEVMAVEEGDRVVPGQILAVLEHNDMKAALLSRQATVARTKAELREAEADFRDKQRKVIRQETLVTQYKTSSREELEASIAQRDMAEARVEAIKANIAFVEASAKETEETIRNMHIVAPFAGTVLAKGAEVGETITPGGMGAASGRGSVVTLANLELQEVETDITEAQISKVSIGQPAEVMVTASPDKRYAGRVRKIVPLGDRARATVKVYVQILNPDERLFPELVAIVNFLPNKERSEAKTQLTGLFVPKGAVMETGETTSVWRIGADKTIHKVTVLTSPKSDDLLKVEDGLKAGDRVVLNPGPELSENQKVSLPD